MRLGVVSDVHGNAVALQEVLIALEDLEVHEVVCLGDVVGYGPHPGLCVDRVKAACSLTLAGNHDRAVADPAILTRFNPVAAEALRWTAERVGDGDAAWLGSLPEEAAHHGGVLCCHGAPGAPNQYIDTPAEAAAALGRSPQPLALCGHTHVPAALVLHPGGRVSDDWHPWPEGEPLEIKPEARVLLNPGSVGQPRDGDPRAAYAVLDLDAGAATRYRIEYDIESTQKAMARAGLPTSLIDRLANGR